VIAYDCSAARLPEEDIEVITVSGSDLGRGRGGCTA
jgi:arginine deiminase